MGDFRPAIAEEVIRLCVDLNIWVRYMLARRNGSTRPTDSVRIVEAVASGRSSAGPIQLVVSHSMLSRLEDVLARLAFQANEAAIFCSLISTFARRGPFGVAPYMVLGGGTAPTSGSLEPNYNPYDPTSVPPRANDEDGRVLDTALAGRAHIIATLNFAEFQSPNTEILLPGRVQIYRAAQHSILIMHAAEVVKFLQQDGAAG